MKCVILVAGHGTLLESEIRHHGPRNLVGIPKSLLPGVGTKKILDSWWNCLNQKHIFTDVFLVTNADKYKVPKSINRRNQSPTRTLPIRKPNPSKLFQDGNCIGGSTLDYIIWLLVDTH